MNKRGNIFASAITVVITSLLFFQSLIISSSLGSMFSKLPGSVESSYTMSYLGKMAIREFTYDLPEYNVNHSKDDDTGLDIYDTMIMQLYSLVTDVDAKCKYISPMTIVQNSVSNSDVALQMLNNIVTSPSYDEYVIASAFTADYSNEDTVTNYKSDDTVYLEPIMVQIHLRSDNLITDDIYEVSNTFVVFTHDEGYITMKCDISEASIRRITHNEQTIS